MARIDTKRCIKCGEEKPVTTGFYRHGRKCRKCRNAQVVASRREAGVQSVNQRRWRAANPEKSREYGRNWYAAHPEYARPADTRTEKLCGGCGVVLPMHRFAKLRSTVTHFASQCKTCNREKALAWRLANPERVKKQIQRFTSHPDAKIRRQQAYASRRSRKLGNGGSHTAADLRRLFNRFKGKCAYCGADAQHVDHVVPLARGGSNSIGNLLPACKSCNLSKHASLLIEWRRRRVA